MENKHLEPRMHIPKEKGMFYVYLYDTKEQKIIQKYYKGLNDPKKIFEEKLSDTEAMYDALKIQLKSGWVPKFKRPTLPKFIAPEILIGQALNQATENMKKRLKRKTVMGYEGMVRFFIEELKVQKWESFYLSEFEKFHIETMMENISSKRGWQNNEYNKNLVYIKAVFTELCTRLNYIKGNPVKGIPNKKKKARNPYVRLTPEEQTIVINHFRMVLPNFCTWLKTLYHTGIRPAELREMKCSMVEIDSHGENDFFKLPAEITKTDIDRKVPIPADLKKDLLKFDLSNSDNFLFGKHAKQSRFNKLNFQPSQFMLGTNAANDIWKKEIIDKLGIKKYMYSNKHKKASDIIEAGGSLEAIQRAFGHQTKITTEIYAQILEVLEMQEFKDKAIDFK